MEKLASIICEVVTADTPQGLHAALGAGLRSMGFAGFSLGTYKLDKHALVLDPTLTSWSASFAREYEQRGFADVDPLLAKGVATRRAFGWQRSGLSLEQTTRQHREFLRASPFHSGLIVPLAGRPDRLSSLSVMAEADRPYCSRTAGAIAILGNAVVAKSEALGLCAEVPSSEIEQMRALSARQVDILSWISEGKSNGEIAVILDLSKRAVDYHVTEILRKLGVATRVQAAALAAGR